MNYKFSFKDNPGKREHVDFDDFMVFPLEGVWSSYSTDATQKDQFKYKIMIRQPYFVTEDMFKDAIMSAKEKLSKSSNGEDVKSQSSDEKTNKLQLLNQVKFETMEDSLCVHMLHQGPFDDEPESFAQMDEFTNTNNLKRLGKEHREIYLGDFRRTKPENLKTILRYKVEKA
jgi:hypothetical protein